ncbi:MAG: OmpH family outer membrane protein [Cytophagaceae bacterium]
MKNISIALNGVLIVAVAVLYFLHFNQKPAQNIAALVVQEDTTNTPVALPEVNPLLKVAYVNLDSLTQKYEFYQKSIKNLEGQLKNKQNQFKAREAKFYEDIQKYQQMAPSLTEGHRKTKEEALMNEEQELLKLREKLQGDLANQEIKFQKDFLKNLDDYLQDLSKEKKYSYIFTYSKGGPATIVYASDSLEITKEVVDGLNKEYRKKK